MHFVKMFLLNIEITTLFTNSKVKVKLICKNSFVDKGTIHIWGQWKRDNIHGTFLGDSGASIHFKSIWLPHLLMQRLCYSPTFKSGLTERRTVVWLPVYYSLASQVLWWKFEKRSIWFHAKLYKMNELPSDNLIL